jgi:hypothetical protein
MTIRLIKREQQSPKSRRIEKDAPRTQMILKAQEWVSEFKSRKARADLDLLAAIKRA